MPRVLKDGLSTKKLKSKGAKEGEHASPVRETAVENCAGLAGA
jgi:hypothetical protein